MTYSVLNSARHILFLVSGKHKAQIVKTLLQDGAFDLPAKNVNPLNGTIKWLLDQEAASGLS
jgi:6-phosphogluconolactonase